MLRASAPAASLVLLGTWALMASGCGHLGSQPGSGEVAARIGDEVITVAELDETIREELWRRETRQTDGNENPARLHEVRSEALTGLINLRLTEAEARRRGVTVETLLDGAAANVSDADIAAFYAENREQMRGASLEQVADQIRNHLENRKRQQRVQEIVAGANVEIELRRPRLAVSTDGASRGPADARVTIVEFSDFQCPYCRRALDPLKEIEAKYPDDVRIVYRHLPLESIHPRARATAEAAACAAEQDRFWEFHDVVFENARALAEADLRRYAAQAELEPTAFEECVQTRRYAAQVQADIDEANRLGITGTPAFVVNGFVLTGLQTAEAFEELIREELDLPPSS